MTGTEFKRALKTAGFTQGGFAQEMGVSRSTICKQCAATRVEKYWKFALAGLMAARGAQAVSSIVDGGTHQGTASPNVRAALTATNVRKDVQSLAT